MTARSPKLILASGSPQRRALLSQAGYDFRIVPPGPNAECGVCSRESPAEMVVRLARQKAADVAAQLADGKQEMTPDEIIVACDTICECRGRILGKPTDIAHARWMLEWLSGTEHHVYSGLCLRPAAGGDARVNMDRTTLRMDPLSEAQLSEYLDSGQWEGKAGAFGYQDRAGWLHIVAGSESNVIGLPLELLAQMLAETLDRPV